MSGKGAKGLSGKGAKGTMGDKKGDKKKPVSRSARAGLQFPVGRIHRLLKARLHVASLASHTLPLLLLLSGCQHTAVCKPHFPGVSAHIDGAVPSLRAV